MSTFKRCRNCGTLCQPSGQAIVCDQCNTLPNTIAPMEQFAKPAYRHVSGNKATITILDSNWQSRIDTVMFESDVFLVPSGFVSLEKIPITEVISIQILDESSAKSFCSAAVRGLVGGVALGIVGAVAGIASSKTNKTFIFGIRFRDGRTFVGKSNGALIHRVQSFLLSHKPNGDVQLLGEPEIQQESLGLKLLVVGIASIVFFGVLLWIAVKST